jgi:class 3 adenylate cyclase
MTMKSIELSDLEMQRKGDRFNLRQESRGVSALLMGIGINTGTVVACNIGSAAKREYNVISDGVNVAARMQGVA